VVRRYFLLEDTPEIAIPILFPYFY
jgi:hypothetical protein